MKMVVIALICQYLHVIVLEANMKNNIEVATNNMIHIVKVYSW